MVASNRIASPPSAQEFYARYAAESGVTEEWLAGHGRRAYRCNCGGEICDGWQMLSESDVEWDRQHGIALYVEPDDHGYAPEEPTS